MPGCRSASKLCETGQRSLVFDTEVSACSLSHLARWVHETSIGIAEYDAGTERAGHGLDGVEDCARSEAVERHSQYSASAPLLTT